MHHFEDRRTWRTKEAFQVNADRRLARHHNASTPAAHRSSITSSMINIKATMVMTNMVTIRAMDSNLTTAMGNVVHRPLETRTRRRLGEALLGGECP